MYKYIVSFFNFKHSSIKPSSHFNSEFRRGYKNAWINNIKDYTPLHNPQIIFEYNIKT